jgi:hypothetical protein
MRAAKLTESAAENVLYGTANHAPQRKSAA